MSEFAEWFLEFVKNLIESMWNFLIDVLIQLLDLILTALSTLLNALPLPDFLQNGLQGLFSALPNDVLYFVGHFRLGECLSMFGAAVLFRLARKAVTVFQW